MTNSNVNVFVLLPVLLLDEALAPHGEMLLPSPTLQSVLCPNLTFSLLPSISAPIYYGQQYKWCNNTRKHRKCLNTIYSMHVRVGGGNVWQQSPLLSRLDTSSMDAWVAALLAMDFSLFDPILFVDSSSLCYCSRGTVILLHCTKA